MYILYNRLITALNEKKPDSTEFYIAKMMIWNLWELQESRANPFHG